MLGLFEVFKLQVHPVPLVTSGVVLEIPVDLEERKVGNVRKVLLNNLQQLVETELAKFEFTFAQYACGDRRTGRERL